MPRPSSLTVIDGVTVSAVDVNVDARFRMAHSVIHKIADHPRHRNRVTDKTRRRDLGVDRASGITPRAIRLDLRKIAEEHLLFAQCQTLLVGAGQQKQIFDQQCACVAPPEAGC